MKMGNEPETEKDTESSGQQQDQSIRIICWSTESEKSTSGESWEIPQSRRRSRSGSPVHDEVRRSTPSTPESGRVQGRATTPPVSPARRLDHQEETPRTSTAGHTPRTSTAGPHPGHEVIELDTKPIEAFVDCSPSLASCGTCRLNLTILSCFLRDESNSTVPVKCCSTTQTYRNGPALWKHILQSL